MSLKAPVLTIAVGIVLACCAFGAFIFWMADPLHLRSPLDVQLITTFHARRESFERLRQMATQDSQYQSTFSKSDLGTKLSDSRQQEYQSLISDVYSNLVVSVDYDRTTRFIFAGGGLSAIGPGWVKGIEYVPGNDTKKGTVVETLDNVKTLPAGVYLRQIEPKWFVFYQEDDD
jgi:hypothetical protein